MLLPKELFGDFYEMLVLSRGQYLTSRVIVWTSALMVLAMLCGLMLLFHRWVLYPVRLLQRGVRRVARGSFDYKIELNTGDEMQDLAEAFNDMTAKISVTYADLEQQVQERSRQLVRSERLAGVGFLAAGVSHEINNPLASIAFCSEALENRLGGLLNGIGPSRSPGRLQLPEDDSGGGLPVQEHHREAARLLAMQRHQARADRPGHPDPGRGGHDPPHRQVPGQDHPLPAQGSGDGPRGQPGDQAGGPEPGGQRARFHGAGGTLRIEARYSHGMAEMVFVDNGCGMSPDVLENIFEPFFTKRRVGKGTGLGLSITHRIVSQHHGEIMASSPGEGQGATFKVRLPIHPSEIGESRSPRRSPGPAGSAATAAASGVNAVS